jgi:hypothetical protein
MRAMHPRLRLPRNCSALLPLLLGAVSCGPAVFYETGYESDVFVAERDSPEAGAYPANRHEDGFRDATSSLIPEPPPGVWTLPGADPGEQRAVCAYDIDVSRAHVSRAIDTAIALRKHDRVRCLAEKARFLATLRNSVSLFAQVSGEGPVEIAIEDACSEARSLVHEARACR